MSDNQVFLLKPLRSDFENERRNTGAVVRAYALENGYKLSVTTSGLGVSKDAKRYFFVMASSPLFFVIDKPDFFEVFFSQRQLTGAAILSVGKNMAIIDLYGGISNKMMSAKEVEDYAEAYFFSNEKPIGEKSFFGEKEDKSARDEALYDDEIIVGDNYYEYPDVDFKRLKVKDEFGEENENVGACGKTGESKTEKGEFNRDDQNEKNPGGFFYEKIKAELSEIFKNCPPINSLCDMVENSKWVKVPFDDGKSYVTGIIGDEFSPSYICYGVEGRFGIEPKELAEKGRCMFVPASPFDLKGNGYWIMFQKAKNGEMI